MSITSKLRSNLPSTSKSASSPRVSSPLATQSSSVDSGSDNDDNDSSEASSSSEDSEDDDDDDSDSDAELGQYLARAKENARRRALGIATSSHAADSAIAGPSVNLEHSDLILGDEEEENRLPAVFTRHADPSQIFSSSTDIKGKGKARLIAPTNGSLSDEESGPILPGVVSKWGELPRAKKSKNQKKLEKSKSSGKDWFDMPRRSKESLTNEEKRELQALRLGNVMDPKKFMRGEMKRDNKKLPEFFQTGYIIESGQGPRAGLSAPTQKLKKQSFLGNILKDDKGKEWSKKKYLQLQDKASSGGKGFYKKKMRERGSVDGGKRKGKGKGRR